MRVCSENLHRVGFCQLLVALDDDEILIILAARARREVVAAGYHDRVGGEWVDHHDFAVNDGVTYPAEKLLSRHFLGKIRERMLDALGLDDVQMKVCAV